MSCGSKLTSSLRSVLQKLKWHLKNNTTDQEYEIFKCPSYRVKLQNSGCHDCHVGDITEDTDFCSKAG